MTRARVRARVTLRARVAVRVVSESEYLHLAASRVFPRPGLAVVLLSLGRALPPRRAKRSPPEPGPAAWPPIPRLLPAAPRPRPRACPRAGTDAAPAAASDAALRGEVDALRDEVRALRAAGRERARAAAPAAGERHPRRPPPPRPLGYEAFWPWVLPAEGSRSAATCSRSTSRTRTRRTSSRRAARRSTRIASSIRRARVSLTRRVAVRGDRRSSSTRTRPAARRSTFARRRPRSSTGPTASKPADRDGDARPVRHAVRLRARRVAADALVHGALARRRARSCRASPTSACASRARSASSGGRSPALNGEPLGEKSAFALQDPNAAKDVVFRFGVDTTPAAATCTSPATSRRCAGTGFHPGRDATKAGLQWTDLNERRRHPAVELTAVPGAARRRPRRTSTAGPSAPTCACTTAGGSACSKVYGEFVLASNLDRGLYVADPDRHRASTSASSASTSASSQEITPLRRGRPPLRLLRPQLRTRSTSARGSSSRTREAIKTCSPLVGLDAARPRAARLPVRLHPQRARARRASASRRT